ncbi:MAG: SDR family oxidoreductase [Rhizobiales bacterium]|nr:SDR family oxidoreductase [Hyphomicrobiales bacterium]
MTISLKTVVVTGAASGLGHSVVLALGKQSVPVWCLDADAGGAEAVATQVRKVGGVAQALPVNISDPVALSSAFERIKNTADPIDGLVTCAGVQNTTRILDLTPEEWDQVMSINLRGTFLCVQHALRAMTQVGRGRIVTIGSDTAKRGGGRMGKAAYGASKGGVVTFTKSVARELAQLKRDIRVNCVCPGPMLTNMHGVMSPEVKEMVESSVPLGRFGTADEVAAGVLFLLSDEASYIYGETLSVDGGVVMD